MDVRRATTQERPVLLRRARAWRVPRPLTQAPWLAVAASVLATASAWDVARPFGLAVGALGCLYLEWRVDR